MTDSKRQATDNMIHRIAEAKQKFDADNAESYKQASDRIKKERG